VRVKRLPRGVNRSPATAVWTCPQKKTGALSCLLSHPLRQFSVSLGDGESSVLAEPEGVAPKGSTWVVKGLSVGERHAAAVAFRAPVTNFRFWQWDSALLFKRIAFS
jgi:hypothetical protein